MNMIKKNTNNIIIPKERLEKIKKTTNPIFIKNDYGIIIKKNNFKVFKNYCIIPNNLVFSYSMALCKIGKAAKIYVAGLDGYEDNDYKNNEMSDTIKTINKNYKSNLISLFKTKYPIKETSIYSPIIYD